MFVSFGLIYILLWITKLYIFKRRRRGLINWIKLEREMVKISTLQYDDDIIYILRRLYRGLDKRKEI